MQKDANVLRRINALLHISDSYQAPKKIMEILLEWEKVDKARLFQSFLIAYNFDLSFDWFHEYFQAEHADRALKKQDFTPRSICELVVALTDTEAGMIYEPAAGTGGMIIEAWWSERKKHGILSYDPLCQFFIAEELSARVIPFLLFNMSIRGMHGNVLHCDTLTRECQEIYHVQNTKNDPLAFSDVFLLPHSKDAERFFKVVFRKDPMKTLTKEENYE